MPTPGNVEALFHVSSRQDLTLGEMREIVRRGFEVEAVTDRDIQIFVRQLDEARRYVTQAETCACKDSEVLVFDLGFRLQALVSDNKEIIATLRSAQEAATEHKAQRAGKEKEVGAEEEKEDEGERGGAKERGGVKEKGEGRG